VQQAGIVAEHLLSRGLEVQDLVSGDMRRQLDTAAPSARALDCPVAIDPRWNEYSMDSLLATYTQADARASVTDPDQATSPAAYQQLLEQALAAWIAADRNDDGRAPESWEDFQRRAQDALEELAGGLETGAAALVFTSGGVIAALAAALLQLPAATMIGFNRVAVNTGVTKLVSGRRGITLVSFNEHVHLEQTGRVPITYR
jgi:broad specificity phosphatase PhoE